MMQTTVLFISIHKIEMIILNFLLCPFKIIDSINDNVLTICLDGVRGEEKKLGGVLPLVWMFF